MTRMWAWWSGFRGREWGPLRPLRGHLPLKGEDIVVLTVLPLKGEDIVVLTVLPLQGEVPSAARRRGPCGRR